MSTMVPGITNSPDNNENFLSCDWKVPTILMESVDLCSGQVWQTTINNRFIKALAKGALPSDVLERWIQDRYLLMRVYRWFIARLVAKLPTFDALRETFDRVEIVLQGLLYIAMEQGICLCNRAPRLLVEHEILIAPEDIISLHCVATSTAMTRYITYLVNISKNADPSLQLYLVGIMETCHNQTFQSISSDSRIQRADPIVGKLILLWTKQDNAKSAAELLSLAESSLPITPEVFAVLDAVTFHELRCNHSVFVH